MCGGKEQSAKEQAFKKIDVWTFCRRSLGGGWLQRTRGGGVGALETLQIS